MTTAPEICDALAAAGVRIVFADGQPSLTGKTPAPELRAAVKANRNAVIDEWCRREAADRSRYGRVPDPAPDLRPTVLGAADGMSAAGLLRIRRAMEHAAAQGPAVCAWVNARSDAYFERGGVTPLQCDLTACADLLQWQTRMTWGKELFERLETFAAVAAEKSQKHEDTEDP